MAIHGDKRRMPAAERLVTSEWRCGSRHAAWEANQGSGRPAL